MDFISKAALVYFIAALIAGVAFLLLRDTRDSRLQVRSLPRLPLLAYMVSLVLSGIFAVYGAANRAELREPTFDTGNDRVWVALPIGITWNRQDLDVYEMALVGAMTTWNDSVGCELFAQSRPESAGVRVRSYDGQPCGVGQAKDPLFETGEVPGVTWPCPDGTDEIQVNRLDDVNNAYRVFLHELGHVLRLAHDEPGGGIMAPSLAPMNVVLPNRKDVAALRERYCH